MEENGQMRVVDTDHLTPPTASNDLYASRKSVYDRLLSGMPEVTVCVLAYNRLEKTRRCVESILKYTQGITYELLLVDNGSEDGTLEYFQSIQYPNKKILHITKNLGALYATNLAMRSFSGRYFALVINDAIVTKNWLSNLLRCFESDPRIGMVTPGASNVSNLQEIPLSFSSYEEMQRKAAVYNQSDPRKWEQRVRLVAIIYLLKREVVDLIGLDDPGFFHDFDHIISQPGACPVEARRIRQYDLGTAPFQHRKNAVSCGLWLIGHNRDLLPYQRVGQCRLPHIGPSGNCHHHILIDHCSLSDLLFLKLLIV